MRQRPDVHVTLDPGAPQGGDDVVAEVVLHAKTATPVDGVDVRLRSIETVPLGKGALTHVHLALAKTFVAKELTHGDHRFTVRFPLPAGLVPAYESPPQLGAGASIRHILDVHVRIPWWLDRHAAFLVPVRHGTITMRGTPRVYATHPEGPRGDELGVELSLESDVVAPGATIAGAVALVNVASQRVRALRVSLVAIEQAREGAYGVPRVREVARYALKLLEAAPAGGVPTPFRIRFPPDGHSTFGAAYFSHVWSIEATAEITLGRDVSLRAPFHVLPDARWIKPSAPTVAPSIGHERRAKVWDSVAASTGLTLDDDKDRLTGKVGRIALDIALERAGDASRLVAHLVHRSLGIALDAHSRVWTETLRLGETDLGDEAFAKRVTTRGRFDEQIVTLFDGALRTALLAFDEVHLEDDGAALASDSGGRDATALEEFVKRAVKAAEALDRATARVAAPPLMADAEPAWRAYAERTSAHFSPGGMSLEGVRLQGESLDVQTIWEGATPVGTRIALSLASSLDTTFDAEADRMTPEAKRMIDVLRADGLVLEIGASGVEATLHAKVDDPSTIEDRMDRIAHLVRVLSTGPGAGPYR